MKKYLILFCAFIGSLSIEAQIRKLALEDIISNKIFTTTSTPGFQWLPGKPGYSFLKKNTDKKCSELYMCRLPEAKEELIASAEQLTPEGETSPITVMNYKWFPDGENILITGVLPARAVKSGGDFYVFSAAKKTITRSVNSEKEQVNIELSPDGTKIAFARENDLYVYDIHSGMETQLTFDGSETILNGVFDWVYEEEFSVIRGYEWSPDSKSIAFWRLDQSNVPQIAIGKYDSLYLNALTMRYPKPGARNSEVRIGVVDIATAKTSWIDIGNNKDIYIPRIKFTTDANVLAIQRLDRLQHSLELLFANVVDGKTRVILTETDTCWVDVDDDLTFLGNMKQFIWSSERDGFKHLYLYDMSGKLIRQLTRGRWEVDHLIGIDEKNANVYFAGNRRGAMYTDVYRTSLNGSEPELLTTLPGTHIVTFAGDFSYYTDRYSSVSQPSIAALYSISGAKIKDLTTINANPAEKYDLGKTEFVQFTTSDGTMLNGFLIKPPEFNSANKYPVLVYNYSGPGSQIVKDRWGGPDLLWYHFLAQKGYIIFMMDNRGTGGRGKEFKHIVYKRLGDYEVADLIEGAKYLASLEYVDAARIGIWGWSYGGYISTLAILKAADYFKAAIAVAPVTHWKFYDSIYAERFMSLPGLNPEGYESSSVLTYTDKLKGKLLLVHGTADDNVHFQNSVKLVEKLVSENKPFQTMYYPEKDHGIYGGKTRLHLYSMLTDFLLNNL